MNKQYLGNQITEYINNKTDPVEWESTEVRVTQK